MSDQLKNPSSVVEILSFETKCFNPDRFALMVQVAPATFIKSGRTKLTPPVLAPGSILRCRYTCGDGTLIERGLIKEDTGKSFPNGIDVLMSISESGNYLPAKNVTLKFSQSSIHGTGLRQEGIDIMECFDHLKEHIEALEQLFKWVRMEEVNTELFKEEMERYRGDVITREDTYDEDSFVKDYELRKIPVINFDDTFEGQLHRYICSYANTEDMISWNRFSDRMGKILDIIYNNDENIILIAPMVVKKIATCMENYNFQLGYEVHISSIKQEINKLYEQKKTTFMADYNKKRTRVRVMIPYTVENEFRRKTGQKKMTFLVSSTGSVMFSGPGQKYMLKVYDQFIDLMSSIYVEIVNADSIQEYTL